MDNAKNKQLELQELYAPYKDGTFAWPTSLENKNIVPGEGNPEAEIVIIGEAPGKEEDEQGRPFVGRSGKLLTACLQAAGIERKEVYITNIVKIRPPLNRTPTKEEVKFSKKLLFAEIDIIKPKIVCTLGASALSAFIEEPIKMTELKGNLLQYKHYEIYPLFHPAYILRNSSKKSAFIDDFKQLKTLIKVLYVK